MIFYNTTILNDRQKKQLISLWNNEYPKAINYSDEEDFDSYLINLFDVNHTLIINKKQIIGWYADFLRDNQRWFFMILDSKFQRKGFGKQLLDKAKQNHKKMFGWAIPSDDYKKIDGTPYKSPISFYKKMGFDIFESEAMNSKELYAVKIRLCQ